MRARAREVVLAWDVTCTRIQAFSDSDTAAFSHLVDGECRFVRCGYTEDGIPDVTSVCLKP